MGKRRLELLRIPVGARVYVQNVDFKFKFMGALEVVSQAALELYYEKGEECFKHLGHEGGEDFWFMSCMDAIGVGHQSDLGLLRDKYAALNGCSDSKAAAFHFYKTV